MQHSIRSCTIVALGLLLASLCCTQEPHPVFDPDSAWALLVEQCDLGPRPPGSPAHEKLVELLRERLESVGCEVELQDFTIQDPYGPGELRLTNVLGRIVPGRKKRVLLAAHFDTRPRADMERSDSLRGLPILGANDGASGVAVLLEMARIVSTAPPSGLGVDIVFFDGEDYGKERDLDHYLLGSKHFAANLHRLPGGYHPVCGVLLDMVAGKDARIFKELNSLHNAPRLTEELFRRAGRLDLNVFVPRQGKAVYDDHIPLLRAGIRTVDLVDPDYPFWHTLSDVPENCSKETMEQVGRLLVDFLYDFPF